MFVVFGYLTCHNKIIAVKHFTESYFSVSQKVIEIQTKLNFEEQ